MTLESLKKEEFNTDILYNIRSTFGQGESFQLIGCHNGKNELPKAIVQFFFFYKTHVFYSKKRQFKLWLVEKKTKNKNRKVSKL